MWLEISVREISSLRLLVVQPVASYGSLHNLLKWYLILFWQISQRNADICWRWWDPSCRVSMNISALRSVQLYTKMLLCVFSLPEEYFQKSNYTLSAFVCCIWKKPNVWEACWHNFASLCRDLNEDEFVFRKFSVYMKLTRDLTDMKGCDNFGTFCLSLWYQILLCYISENSTGN